MFLKCQKSGRKLVMGCRTAKNAERKGIARNCFATSWEIFAIPLKMSLPPPGRNPETAPVKTANL